MLEYSSDQLDMIREISNIALGNSATSLSKLFGSRVSMTIPDVNIYPIGQFMNDIKDIEVIGKILIIKGEIEGSVLLLFDIDTAKRMISNITCDKISDQESLDEIRSSFVEEVCNIVGSTYIRNIADYLNIRMEIESSTLLFDNLTAILSYTFMEEEQFDDNIINIHTDFRYELESSPMNVYFYFVPRKGNLNKIINL